MSQQKSILVGIDYSTASINALREASRMANAEDLPLVCFHILDEEIFHDFKHHEHFDRNAILEFAYDKLNQFIRDAVGTAHDLHAYVSIGTPFLATIDYINTHNAETLVLGSRGFSSEAPHSVGALATLCVRKAPCEVLLMRRPQDKPFKRIAACIDFSDCSIRAAHRAAEIARQDGAELRLIHIYRPPVYTDSDVGWLGPAFPMVQEPSVRESCENRLETIGYEIGSTYDLQNISTLVHRNHSATKGIHDALQEMEAELVVLGTRGRTGWKKLLLGTTAESLVHTTPCSTLAVKPEDFSYSVK